MKKTEFNYSGFTLIEILVVITIISLISIASIVSFSQLGKQSRDSRRKADIEQTRSALEMYQQSNVYRSYPTNLNTLVNGSVQYLKSIPLDPKTNIANITYTSLPAGCNGTSVICTSYTLTSNLETGGVYQSDPFGGTTLTATTAPPQPSNTQAVATKTPTPTFALITFTPITPAISTKTPTPTSIQAPTPTSGSGFEKPTPTSQKMF